MHIYISNLFELFTLVERIDSLFDGFIWVIDSKDLDRGVI